MAKMQPANPHDSILGYPAYTSDAVAEKLIADQAQDVLWKIKESRLCGRPIDVDNRDHLMVAAYCLGQQETRVDMKREQASIEELSGFDEPDRLSEIHGPILRAFDNLYALIGVWVLTTVVLLAYIVLVLGK